MSLLSASARLKKRAGQAVRYGFEELRLVRDLGSFRALARKALYVVPRATGGVLRTSNAPPSLQIEPTNHCNVSCLCCSVSRSSRPRGLMDYMLYHNIIGQAAGIGVRRIHLYLHGEPFLHPRIAEMVRHAKALGLSVNITTNGMNFGHEKRLQLLNAGMDLSDHITFSILGCTKATHETIMKGVLHEQVVDNILEFMQERHRTRARGPIIETMFYSMDENLHEREAYASFWRGKVDHPRVGGAISTSFMGHGKQETRSKGRNSTCTNIWERMTVFWDGRVALCCEDVDGQVILGDLSCQSITEIWNSERLQSIRSVHRRGAFKEFPFCDSCDM
jgi:radical SAM protein with 4Fe4S-binding SPASM domain